jgi:hypothetical protein
MAAKRALLFGLLMLPVAAAGQAGNCTQTDPSTRPDCARAIAFFRDLQSALRKDDRKAIAAMVDYPVRVSLNHKRVRVRGSEQLLAHFDEIFDKDVRCSILEATEKDVWGNWEGFMVGRGAIWFDGIIPAGDKPDIHVSDYWTKYPMKIKTINNGSDFHCAAQSPAPSSPSH